MRTLIKSLNAFSSKDEVFDFAPAHVVVKRSERARRMSLRLDHRTRLFTLTLPLGIGSRQAKAFLKRYDTWMEERLSALPDEIILDHGVVVPLLGRERVITIDYRESYKSTRFELLDDELIVRTNKREPYGRLLRYLKSLAQEVLETESKAKAAQIGKKIMRVSVRDTKSRWGSCSHDGKLSYSWRLIFAPNSARDYVIAHEVAHLQHLDHSKAFWEVCKSLSNNYDYGKCWMHEHGHELMKYQCGK